MFNTKNLGFTLSETLITLSIIGLVAVLVLPGLMKNSANRANIALLQSTVSNFNDAVQNEVLSKNVNSSKDTDVYNNPKAFLENNFDIARSVANKTLFATKYSTIDGQSYNMVALATSANLKNGVAIGITNHTGNNPVSTVYININGTKSPNVVGVDMFALRLYMYNSPQAGVSDGTASCSMFPNSNSLTFINQKKACDATGSGTRGIEGQGQACYCALELSGFDADYLSLTE